MKYFDSHAHYYDERFSELEGGAERLLDSLFEDSASYIINVGTDPSTCRLAISQAKKYERMYTALGIHPSDCRLLTGTVEEELSDIEALILDKSNKCVALGEIGLDYHYPDTDKEKQMAYFKAQLEMAQRLDIPVVIHDREAHADIMDIVRQFPKVRGVFHSFSGSVEMAKELVFLGYMISFSGTLTFTNAKKPKEVAVAIPLDKILIETDCPYLAPHPKRGTINHSGNLAYTCSVLAALKGVSEEEAATVTELNAKNFFGIC